MKNSFLAYRFSNLTEKIIRLMLKQTVLTFQNALGFLGYDKKRNDRDGDSGNSSSSDSSDENQAGSKENYTSTGVLIPRGQPINEIVVSRHSMNSISAIIDGYKAKTKQAK